MEVSEERLAVALAILKTVEVCVQRIGKIPRVAGRVDRVGRAIQVRTLFPNEVLPGRFVSHGARAGQRQILEVQRGETTLEVPGARVFVAEGTGGTRVQRLGKDVLWQLPRIPLRSLVEACNQGGVKRRRWHASARSLLACRPDVPPVAVLSGCEAMSARRKQGFHFHRSRNDPLRDGVANHRLEHASIGRDAVGQWVAGHLHHLSKHAVVFGRVLDRVGRQTFQVGTLRAGECVEEIDGQVWRCLEEVVLHDDSVVDGVEPSLAERPEPGFLRVRNEWHDKGESIWTPMAAGTSPESTRSSSFFPCSTGTTFDGG